ncbi:glutathione S-transferase [Dactylonectria estremocensis]|uniref:Glutathione S-transferase n=1 Tax=Dactylonectria estremocensis TaxID=1079267 RepID=A0A9P9IMU4_9HYPO|nr:glutathione S-transferase [Dactylonectria estremocensis]
MTTQNIHTYQAIIFDRGALQLPFTTFLSTLDRKRLTDEKGHFHRPATVIRNFISGQPGSRFPAEKGRYHLYAHRVLITRKLKGLEDVISFSAVHWHLDFQTGMRFATPADTDAEGENVVPDPLHDNFRHLRQVFSVPVLYDKKVIVNNESSEILRIFGTELLVDDLIEEKYRAVSLYAAEYQQEIDEAHKWQYNDINNGVYICGFASSQKAYDQDVTALFRALDKVEAHLASNLGPYWFGTNITEVDMRLFVTIIRFDPVYTYHFKCNLRDIRSGYPHINKWLRTLYWEVPAFKDTTNFLHIKNHYTRSHGNLNPSMITAAGPSPDILGLDEEVAAARVAIK